MPPPNRPLGRMEEALVLTSRAYPTGLVAVVRFHEGPEPARLARAFALVQRQEPMLRVRVRDGEEGPAFEVVPDCPPIPIHHSPHRDWLDLVGECVNEPIDDAGAPLLQAYYLTMDGQTISDLVLHAHHAVADGTALASLIVRTLRLIDTGTDPPSTVPDGPEAGPGLPAPADDLLPKSSRGLRGVGSMSRFALAQLVSELRYRWIARNTRKQPLLPQSRSLVSSRSLPVAATTDFVQRGRRLGLTINSLLASALLLTIYRHAYAPRPTPLRHIGWADLRVYLSPALRSDVLGCYVSMLRHDVLVFPEDSLTDLAARLQDDVVRSFARGDKWSSLSASRSLMQFLLRHEKQRMGTTALSYWGVPPIPAAVGPYRIRQLNAFVPTNRLGPELAATAHLDFGRLTLDFMVMDAEIDQSTLERLADEVIELLQQMDATPA